MEPNSSVWRMNDFENIMVSNCERFDIVIISNIALLLRVCQNICLFLWKGGESNLPRRRLGNVFSPAQHPPRVQMCKYSNIFLQFSIQISFQIFVREGSHPSP